MGLLDYQNDEHAKTCGDCAEDGQRGDPAFRTTSAFELTPILVDTVDRRLLALDAATDRACAVLQTVTPP